MVSSRGSDGTFVEALDAQTGRCVSRRAIKRRYDPTAADTVEGSPGN